MSSLPAGISRSQIGVHSLFFTASYVAEHLLLADLLAMLFLPPFLQRLITTVTIVVLIVLGGIDSFPALTRAPDQSAPEQCICAYQLVHQVSTDGLHDTRDEPSDQEQLLHFVSERHQPALNDRQAISYQAAFWPRPAAPPLLHPPSITV